MTGAVRRLGHSGRMHTCDEECQDDAEACHDAHCTPRRGEEAAMITSMHQRDTCEAIV